MLSLRASQHAGLAAEKRPKVGGHSALDRSSLFVKQLPSFILWTRLEPSPCDSVRLL